MPLICHAALLLATGTVLANRCYSQEQPQIKLNVLNVCSPSPEEQQEIASGLAKVPQKASFSQDFEIDRGRSIPEQSTNVLPGGLGAELPSDAGPADWVRIRREFAGSSPFSSVQYSFSRDAKSMVETLVFRIREPRDVMQIALEDSASSVTTAASMLSADTPSSRIKLERFGKSSVILARCTASESGPAPDQSAYEPLFHHASEIVDNYRNLLHVRRTVAEELSRISMPSGEGRNGARAGPKNAAQNKSH